MFNDEERLGGCFERLAARVILFHRDPQKLSLGKFYQAFGETRRYGSHPALRTLYRKLQFLAVDYLVQGIRIIETVRVLLGGTPIRY